MQNSPSDELVKITYTQNTKASKNTALEKEEWDHLRQPAKNADSPQPWGSTGDQSHSYFLLQIFFFFGLQKQAICLNNSEGKCSY